MVSIEVFLSKVKYTLSILWIYWKDTFKVYLTYTSSILEATSNILQLYFKYILEVYYKYTSTCWITKEEYLKCILFQQKKDIWSTFCEIKSAF